MKENTFRLAAAAAGVAATFLGNVTTQAQSSDALLDKLVDKGILSVKEANELRDEMDAGFRKSYQVKSGMPDWVTSFKLNGDFRGRYEMFESPNDGFTDRNRFRYRLRLGAVATIKDNLEAGVRFTSSEPTGNFGGDPISGNTTFQDNASKKFVYLDLAYGRWSFLNTKPVSAAVTIGKMENPFTFSDAVFDADYTPEGAGFNLTYRPSDVHAFKFNSGAFVLDEAGGSHNDPWLYGGQVRWDAAWNKHIATSLGAALLNIVDDRSLTTNAIPGVNRGNTREGVAGAPPAVHFNPVIVDAAITYTLDEAPFYKSPFPIRLAGEYMNNLAADDRQHAWQGGITFGKAGKKGLWEISYRYKYLGADSWFEELTDSDFGAYYAGVYPNSGVGAGYGAGTNIRGHIAKVSYSPFDALTLSATYIRSRIIHREFSPVLTAGTDDNSDMTRLQVDALWKF